MEKTYFVKTYGCQANKADSERIAASLEKKGYQETTSVNQADLVIINSCSVRQSAEDRIGGLAKNLTLQRKKNGKPKKIILTGCALYHNIPWLKERFKNIDEFIPTSDLIDPQVSPKRGEETHAWVPIMEGCSHFCTYCVVPYARGKEVSRPPEEIICEVKALAKQGYQEITLLGQNVNAYGKDLKMKKNKSPFALLLKTLHQVPKIKKISFVTSNPWDLTNDIIEAMSLPKIDRYLHLPVQSGDNEILRRMNRPYTTQEYLQLIKKIREKIPDIKIGTDIIVGFPGETKEQFQNTVNLCKKTSFTKAYIARYSPRPGTVAFKLKDNVPYQEKKRRGKILDEIINKEV